MSLSLATLLCLTNHYWISVLINQLIFLTERCWPERCPHHPPVDSRTFPPECKDIIQFEILYTEHHFVSGIQCRHNIWRLSRGWWCLCFNLQVICEFAVAFCLLFRLSIFSRKWGHSRKKFSFWIPIISEEQMVSPVRPTGICWGC